MTVRPAYHRGRLSQITCRVDGLGTVIEVEAYLASRPPPWGDDAPTVEIDEMQLNQLRALGYGVQ